MLLLLLVALTMLCVVSQPVEAKLLPCIRVIGPYPASALWAGGYSGWFP